MTNHEIEQFREFYEMAEQSISASGEKQFLNFLQFCVERLNKGDSVQEVWNDFLGKAP